MYARLVDGSFRKSKMIDAEEDVYKHIDRDSTWYISTLYFNEEHKKQFDKTKSVSGIRDVTTNKLWWDFDCKSDVSKAHDSTKELVQRLLKHGFKEKDLQIKFSGGKGFHVIVDTDKMLKRDEVEAICSKIGGDLLGFDTSVYLPTQLIRIPLTKHNKTGLYARPIKMEDLLECDFETIKASAKSVEDISVENYKKYHSKASLPDNVYNFRTYQMEKKVEKLQVIKELEFNWDQLDFTAKPKFLDNARWALQNGFFYGSESKANGDRTKAMLCLAATYKNLGFEKEHTYRMLKGVAELQSNRTKEDRFANTQLWNEIIASVYGPNWKGGQFSIHDPKSWLYQYAKEYNIPLGDEDHEPPMRVFDIDGQFTSFIKNIEQNTIKTGIDELDKLMPLTTGMNLGILGAPGSGKTALALKILENTSKAGVITVFASLDMHRNRMYEKLIYRITGLPREEIYRIFKEDGEQKQKILNQIKERYGNVWFYDRSAATVASVRDYIHRVEKQTGDKVKMIMFDYFERINSDVSDDTASSKKIANEIQDLINDLNLVGITFVQPNKFSLGGGPDNPILSYTSIKGSSFLYQSFRAILSLWRPGFNPKWSEMDNFMQMAILKNDLGELKQLDFHWDGKRGEIRPLEDIERKELKELLDMKKGENEDEPKKGW